MKGPYDDIIDLPHPTSENHPRMSMVNRAAQFTPFAALTGYEDAIRETARLTGRRIELSEEEKAILDARLRLLVDGPAQPAASFTYFQPDERKDGGAYVTVDGTIKRIDSCAHEIILTNGRRIPIADILDIQ